MGVFVYLLWFTGKDCCSHTSCCCCCRNFCTKMSNKAKGYGLTAELEKKKAEKFDADRANEAIEWLAAVVAHVDPNDPDIATLVQVEKMDDVCRILKDGRVLCKVMNALYPGSIKKINKIDNPNSPFKKTKETENIANFLKYCVEKAGCVVGDLFQAVDLYECDNIPVVVDGIYSLGRKMHSHADQSIPALGPRESDENKREFTEEQKAAGKNIIGLQMGTNECASQSGLNMGLGRQINKKEEAR